jgi:hypothetical protein
MQDVLVDRTSVLCNNLSTATTREHTDSALSPTHLELMGGARKPGEPGKYSPGNTSIDTVHHQIPHQSS